jgi:GNAT superfamily N-acetyltransferase
MHLRKATLADIPALDSLIAASARALGTTDYTSEQIEAALLGAFGVDSDLIRDGTYFVGTADDRAILCGGWSKRATAFGSDAYAKRESRLLDPKSEPARIRAFFVHPDWARRGLATQLLAACESETLAAGFTRAELTATLPGERFYAKHGYTAGARHTYDLAGGVTIDFVPMHRQLK